MSAQSHKVFMKVAVLLQCAELLCYCDGFVTEKLIRLCEKLFPLPATSRFITGYVFLFLDIRQSFLIPSCKVSVQLSSLGLFPLWYSTTLSAENQGQ